MALIDIINQKKEKVEALEVSEDVFNTEVNEPLVHQVLKAQLAGRRRGTAKTKTKGEVRGGGRKPFRQKGTGNARQGSIRSPLQPGGGQTFGPRPRSYEQSTPKEMIRGALRSVLSDKFQSSRLLVLDHFELEKIHTKTLSEILKNQLKVTPALIVDEKNNYLELSGRNLPKSKILRPEALNVYDLLHKEWLILTKRALQAIEKRLAPETESIRGDHGNTV